MAFLTAQPIAQLGIELLSRSLVLPATASVVPAPDLRGPAGGSVTVRVPIPRTANRQDTPGAEIQMAPIEEHEVTVRLAHLYDAAPVTDEELTLDIAAFGEQVLLPQVEAVARAGEDQLAAELNSLEPADDPDLAWADPSDVEDTVRVILAARAALTVNGAPLDRRFLAVAPDVASRILAVPQLTSAADRGDGGRALTDATVGRLFGFDCVESPALASGTAVAYHRSAFCWATVAPAEAEGARSAYAASDGQMSLRHALAFDVGRLTTVSAVSVFAGAGTVTEDDGGEVKRAIKIAPAES